MSNVVGSNLIGPQLLSGGGGVTPRQQLFLDLAAISPLSNWMVFMAEDYTIGSTSWASAPEGISVTVTTSNPEHFSKSPVGTQDGIAPNGFAGALFEGGAVSAFNSSAIEAYYSGSQLLTSNLIKAVITFSHVGRAETLRVRMGNNNSQQPRGQSAGFTSSNTLVSRIITDPSGLELRTGVSYLGAPGDDSLSVAVNNQASTSPTAADADRTTMDRFKIFARDNDADRLFPGIIGVIAVCNQDLTGSRTTVQNALRTFHGMPLLT